ncbi:hypothetical protein Tco_1574930 [Tanacetum coccineum]
MFDGAFKRVNTFVNFRTDLVDGSSKRAGEELEQENAKTQKVEDNKETTKLKKLMEIILDEEEEVAIDAIPLAVKEDLEDLYKLVKARYGSIRPVESMDYLLWNDMKIITFLDDVVYADLHVGREEVSSYTTYTFNDVRKEDSN